MPRIFTKLIANEITSGLRTVEELSEISTPLNGMKIIKDSIIYEYSNGNWIEDISQYITYDEDVQQLQFTLPDIALPTAKSSLEITTTGHILFNPIDDIPIITDYTNNITKSDLNQPSQPAYGLVDLYTAGSSILNGSFVVKQVIYDSSEDTYKINVIQPLSIYTLNSIIGIALNSANTGENVHILTSGICTVLFSTIFEPPVDKVILNGTNIISTGLGFTFLDSGDIDSDYNQNENYSAIFVTPDNSTWNISFLDITLEEKDKLRLEVSNDGNTWVAYDQVFWWDGNSIPTMTNLDSSHNLKLSFSYLRFTFISNRVFEQRGWHIILTSTTYDGPTVTIDLDTQLEIDTNDITKLRVISSLESVGTSLLNDGSNNSIMMKFN